MNDLTKQMNTTKDAAMKAKLEEKYAQKKKEFYEWDGLANNLGKRRKDLNAEFEKEQNIKKEADDYMISVEAEKAEKETQKKKKAFQNAKSTFNTKKARLEQMEEKEFSNTLSTSEKTELETLRIEFATLEAGYNLAKEENDEKEKEARNKAFDKANRDRDNFTHNYEKAKNAVADTKQAITDVKV